MKWLVLVVLATGCSQDRGAPVKPRTETTRPQAPKSITLDEYETAIYAAGREATYQPTSPSEHDAIAKLVPGLLEAAWASASADKFQGAAAAAGFRIDVMTIGGETYWALVEKKPHGAGAYIFRVGPRAHPVILLQAPHAYHDVGTGRLAAELFFGARKGVRPAALFTNTLHRYQLAPGDKKKRKHNPADVAHNPEHAFTVATDAFTLAAGHTRVVQVHGFASRIDEEDSDGDPGSISMVISAGDKTASSPLSAAIAAAAAQAFGSDVKRYPEDTKVLGATTNAQGRLLKKTGRGDFVHVEISAELRKQLAASEEMRAKLATVLFDTNGERP